MTLVAETDRLSPVFLIGTHTGNQQSRYAEVVGSEDLLAERDDVARNLREAERTELLERDLEAYLRGGEWTTELNEDFIPDF